MKINMIYLNHNNIDKCPTISVNYHYQPCVPTLYPTSSSTKYKNFY